MMLMVVAAAALLVMIVVVMMLMAVAAAALLVMIVMVVLVIVATMALFMIVVVVMLVIVTAVALFMIVVVMMLMVVAAAALLVMIVVVVPVIVSLLGQACQLTFQGIGALHGFQELGTGQIFPGSGDDDGGGIMLAEQADGGLDLGGGGGVGMGEDDAAGVLHLIVEKLAEILHIHLALARINDRGKAVQYGTLGGGTLYGADHVGELTHTRRLDQNTVGGILGQHLGQGLAEVAHQGAADTARVHFVDLNACLGQKASVDADLAEFVLDQHQLLTCVGLGDELFDEGGFTGTQKAGENVDFGHDESLLCRL